MVIPSGALAAALVTGGLGAAIALLVLGLAGTTATPNRPPGRAHRLAVALRSPVLTGRLAAAAGAAVLTLVLTRWPVAAVGIGALVALWPRLFGGTSLEQSQIARLEALVSWTEALRDTVSAHASLERAIPATAVHAPAAIRSPLIRLIGQIRSRVPLETALLALAARLDDASADLIIAALILNIRRRGDGLAAVLGGLAAAGREELDLRRRVAAGRSGLRRGVQIVVLITVVYAGALALTASDYVAPYRSGAGQLALLVVIAMFAAGFAWMRRLSGAEPSGPFLARPGQAVDPDDLRVVAGLTGLGAAAAGTEPGVTRPDGTRPDDTRPGVAEPGVTQRAPGSPR